MIQAQISNTMRDALTESFRLLEATFPSARKRDRDAQWTAFAVALRDVDPSTVQIATTDLIRTERFFPKPAQLREACQSVAFRRRTAIAGSTGAETTRPDWHPRQHGQPCPNCGQPATWTDAPCHMVHAATPAEWGRARAIEEPRERARTLEGLTTRFVNCRNVEPHIRRTIVSPDCRCWDGSDRAPSLTWTFRIDTTLGA